jgi:hypothetical protein
MAKQWFGAAECTDYTTPAQSVVKLESSFGKDLRKRI